MDPILFPLFEAFLPEAGQFRDGGSGRQDQKPKDLEIVAIAEDGSPAPDKEFRVGSGAGMSVHTDQEGVARCQYSGSLEVAYCLPASCRSGKEIVFRPDPGMEVQRVRATFRKGADLVVKGYEYGKSAFRGNFDDNRLNLRLYDLSAPGDLFCAASGAGMICGIPAGRYRLEADADGFIRQRKEITLAPGETRELSLTFLQEMEVRLHPVLYPGENPIGGGEYVLRNVRDMEPVRPIGVKDDCVLFRLEEPGLYRPEIVRIPGGYGGMLYRADDFFAGPGVTEIRVWFGPADYDDL